jgi:hypothetical protein
MSLLAIILLVALFALMFSEFGYRVQARNAGLWILMAAFIFIAATVPQALRPLADALGVALVSNLVLAMLVMFLFLQAYELSAELTTNNRKLRQMVSRLAAARFVANAERTTDAGAQKKALVILPCFNEEASLLQVIPRVMSIAKSEAELRIDYCFVDDGSSDRTLNLLHENCPRNFVSHDANIGVSGVLLTGFQIMRRDGYDYLIQCDSDGQHPIEDIPILIKRVVDSGCELLIGSRFYKAPGLQLSTHERGEDTYGTTRARIMGIIVISHTLLC